ncbi:hypothetical protein [Mesobacillus foraminis]|uniref:hypothetical protein n=1 Tax=Mesobacillus foraminis TaxID=279826 RepID=UPI000EF494C9|nr:hypothetical protein [Mesobacillus foraminis]
MDIYQKIWDADMMGNGIRPITAKENRNLSEGFVVVDLESCGPEHSLFKEVHIPDYKRGSYQLVEKLFDNYALDQTRKERNNRSESREVQEFLLTAMETPPLRVAKQYMEKTSGVQIGDQEWYTYLHDRWFRQFNWDSGKDLSGFEHVFIGEQNRKRLVGHHFWYKYYLEDNPHLNKLHQDQIELDCLNLEIQKRTAPYVLTMGYHLKAFDYEKRRFIDISKKRCGFFVGMSAEGLLALGTVRAMLNEEAVEYFTLNGVKYQLELFMSPDNKCIRTFYPMSENLDS